MPVKCLNFIIFGKLDCVDRIVLVARDRRDSSSVELMISSNPFGEDLVSYLPSLWLLDFPFLLCTL